VKEWEEAIPKAREAYLLKLNADRARQQAEQWERAAQLRSYSQAIRHQAEEFDEQAQRHVLEWATWIDEHADRIDPLNDKSQLTMSESSTLGAKELDPYMPHGWSVENPPGPRTWLP
jgi:exonuclease VII large subunit